MVGLIVTLTPIRIQKLKKKLQRERDIANLKLKISQKITSKQNKNPLQRKKFQID